MDRRHVYCGTRLWRHPSDSRFDFERALSAFHQRSDASGVYLAWSNIVMSHIISSRSDSLDAWVNLLAELKRDCPTFPSKEVEAHVAGSMLAAIAWHQTIQKDPTGRSGHAISRDTTRARWSGRLWSCVRGPITGARATWRAVGD
jgi:hypothetical protein